jgi:hypothetical protein
MPPAARHALALALEALHAVRDVVDERVDESVTPNWVEGRGWGPFLAALSDADVARAEACGLAATVDSWPSAPADLRRLAHQVREATRLDAPAQPQPTLRPASLRRVGQSKRLQLEGMLQLCRPLVARARRVLDVGSGHGHLARSVAEAFGATTVGLEREPGRVEIARGLVPTGASLGYRVVDLLTEPWDLGSGDLAIGLHACGELGDATVRAVAQARCDMVLVSCCFQKIRGPARAPLSQPMVRAGMELRREVLGLANLSSREQGVAGTITEVMQARRNRLGLRLLLRGRGLETRPGEEMRGLNRRRAYGALEPLAEAALAVRGLPATRAGESEAAEREARRLFARVRRLSLPRNMLARLLEVSIALDRACFLEESGLGAKVVAVFADAASPRNLAVVACPA